MSTQQDVTSHSLKVGLTNEITWLVQERHLACAITENSLPVLATSMLIALCEECAQTAVEPLLPKDQTTVGVRLTVEHLAPTPESLHVTAQAELVKVEDELLHFQIKAWDEIELIGVISHERHIVKTKFFERRYSDKLKFLAKNRKVMGSNTDE